MTHDVQLFSTIELGSPLAVNCKKCAFTELRRCSKKQCLWQCINAEHIAFPATLPYCHCSIDVPAGVTHQLVRNYLLFYGYADTLAAFDTSAGLTGSDTTKLERLAFLLPVSQQII